MPPRAHRPSIPISFEAEQATLGAILLRPQVLNQVADLIGPKDFYRQAHGRIFQAMLDLHRRAEPVDQATVAALLRERGQLDEVGGPVFLVSLGDQAGTAANAVYYAKKVAEAARRRQLRLWAARLQKAIEDGEDPAPLLAEMPYHGPEGKGFPIVRFSQVRSEEVGWLWEPYVPTGKLTLIEGDPSAGKTWIALAICTRLTNQGLTCVYASGDDGLRDTLKPRAEALGADLDLLHAIEGIFSLTEINRLRATILKLRPALLVLDPLQSFLGGGVDFFKANEVRERLNGLIALAAETGTAVILVRHLRKSPTDRSIYRGMGSIDFSAAARSVLLVGRTPEGKRALIQIKNSLTGEGPALGFELGSEGFFWTGETNISASDLLAAEDAEAVSARQEAREFLQHALGHGPVEAKEIEKQARTLGISKITLRRAKAELKVEAVPQRDNAGKISGWAWQLPDAHIDHLDSLPPREINEHLDKPPGNADEFSTSTRCSPEIGRASGSNVESMRVSEPENQMLISLSRRGEHLEDDDPVPEVLEV